MTIEDRCSACHHTLPEHESLGWTCNCRECPWMLVQHVHDWRPVPNWVARYRCADPACAALGWKRIIRIHAGMDGKLAGMQQQDVTNTLEIVPYICTRRECTKNAISHSRKSGQFCRAHLRESTG